MKLLFVAVASAIAETELSRAKRAVSPQQCRANCDADYDYGIIEDKDSCYDACGMVNAVAEEANAELGSCQK